MIVYVINTIWIRMFNIFWNLSHHHILKHAHATGCRSLRLVLRLLCRFSVSLPVSLFPSTCDMMMEMCIPGGLPIKTQEIRLLISSKHHSLSLFAKGKYAAGICPERIDLPVSPTKNRSLPPAVTESYQSRGCECEVCWKRLSSSGHYCHCISLTHAERCSNDFALSWYPGTVENIVRSFPCHIFQKSSKSDLMFRDCIPLKKCDLYLLCLVYIFYTFHSSS